jgi:hypothetical protein
MRARYYWFEEEPETVERECIKLTIELEKLEEMSEEEACSSYNVDSKEEARQAIIDWYK